MYFSQFFSYNLAICEYLLIVRPEKLWFFNWKGPFDVVKLTFACDVDFPTWCWTLSWHWFSENIQYRLNPEFEHVLALWSSDSLSVWSSRILESCLICVLFVSFFFLMIWQSAVILRFYWLCGKNLHPIERLLRFLWWKTPCCQQLLLRFLWWKTPCCQQLFHLHVFPFSTVLLA